MTLMNEELVHVVTELLNAQSKLLTVWKIKFIPCQVLCTLLKLTRRMLDGR